MEYLLFAGYLMLAAWLVTKVKFFTRAGLTNAQLIIIFLLKVMAGILYGWIGIYYGGLAQVVDTWGFHYLGLQEYKLLHTNPSEYLTNMFYNPYEDGFYLFFSSSHSFWQNLKGNAMVKLLSIFDIFSLGNYYINSIFYCFLTFFGSMGIYRVMENVFPGKKKQLILAVFLIPSFLFWTSGIHKEGLIFTGISIIIFNTYFSLRENRLRLKRVAYILGGLFLVFVFRNFLVISLIPALIAWIVAAKLRRRRSLVVFGAIYLLFGIFFFAARYVTPRLDFPSIVVAKQQDFLRLQGGNSLIAIKELKPDIHSFAAAMPPAMMSAVIRPLPGDVKNILSLAAAIEINFLLLLFILFLIRRTGQLKDYAFVCFCVFFSLSTLLIIGYTVNFMGAIVRYRSIVLPLLAAPMVALTNWSQIGMRLSNRRKNQITQISPHPGTGAKTPD